MMKVDSKKTAWEYIARECTKPFCSLETLLKGLKVSLKA